MTRWLIALALLYTVAARADAPAYDVVVVGGTPAGVTAAVAAARLGERVLLLERSAHLGGVVSGGLTASDVGRATTIGGLSREFFDRIVQYYTRTYGADSAQVRDCRSGTFFEPRAAERVFNEMVAGEPRITLHLRYQLASVRRDGARIAQVAFDGLAAGRRVSFAGAVYVDATYEGDLMAGAGVPYRVGREGVKEYGEPHALGSPQRPGDPERGDRLTQAYNYRLCLTQNPDNLVPVVQPEGYSPDLYPLLKARLAERGRTMHFTPDIFNAVAVPNGKVDANAGHNAGQTSDYVGANTDYPDGPWEQREETIRQHRRYVQGLLYFVQNDASVPEDLRAEARSWGLARDEFADNDHWPYQLYIREARRMRGMHVFREQDATEDRHKADSVGVGSYSIDIHTTERRELGGGRVALGGGLSIHGIRPYEIPYGVIVPREVENLLVPVCCSATNVGYGTLRMEPVYMILGHAAGAAAHLAHAGGVPVQRVPVPELQRTLADAKQILRANRIPVAAFEVQGSVPVKAGEPVYFRSTSTDDRGIAAHAWDFDGNGSVDSTEAEPTHAFVLSRTHRVYLRVRDTDGDWSEPTFRDVAVTGGAEAYPDQVADNDAAQFEGRWPASTVSTGFQGKDYRHDGDEVKGAKVARYTLDLPAPGRWHVALSYAAELNRATNTVIVVRRRGGEERALLNQRRRRGFLPFEHVGTYLFDRQAVVEIRNEGTDGYVIADAVSLTYAGPE